MRPMMAMQIPRRRMLVSPTKKPGVLLGRTPGWFTAKRLFLFRRFLVVFVLVFVTSDHRFDHAEDGFTHSCHINVSNDKNQHRKGRSGMNRRYSAEVQPG